MTCQNCSDLIGHDICPDCSVCVAAKYPPVSALGVAERLKDSERVYRPLIHETRLVLLGSTLGMMFAVIIVAVFIVWLTL